MPRTPDRFPGEADEEGLLLEETDSDPTIVGGMRLVGGDFRLRDSAGVFNPRTGGTGLTEEQHKALRQLIHFIDEGPAEGFISGAYKEVTPAGPSPTSIIWWASTAKTNKIVELIVTWSGVFPTWMVWKVYDVAGALLATVSDAITYSGAFESTRTRTITVP